MSDTTPLPYTPELITRLRLGIVAFSASGLGLPMAEKMARCLLDQRVRLADPDRERFLVDEIVYTEACARLNDFRRAAEAVAAPLRPLSEWHEDVGPVMWWRFPIDEPPYLGSPLDLGQSVGLRLLDGKGEEIAATETTVGGWPGYHTHWTPITVPVKDSWPEPVVEAAAEESPDIEGAAA